MPPGADSQRRVRPPEIVVRSQCSDFVSRLVKLEEQRLPKGTSPILPSQFTMNPFCIDFLGVVGSRALTFRPN
jgi:hypothetical protein